MCGSDDGFRVKTPEEKDIDVAAEAATHEDF
jgi:hypothetical protein